jgi:hypothetical protein
MNKIDEYAEGFNGISPEKISKNCHRLAGNITEIRTQYPMNTSLHPYETFRLQISMLIRNKSSIIDNLIQENHSSEYRPLEFYIGAYLQSF